MKLQSVFFSSCSLVHDSSRRLAGQIGPGLGDRLGLAGYFTTNFLLPAIWMPRFSPSAEVAFLRTNRPEMS